MSDRRYPPRPIPAVGALIFEDVKILLIQRGKPPMLGYWSLPGGAVEVGESLHDALRREIREETGLEVEIDHLQEIFERITTDAAGGVEYHYVIADYVCRPVGGSLLAASDAAAAGWFAEPDLESLELTSGSLPVIARAFAWWREGNSR